MSTRKEIEAKIAAAQKDITKRVDAMASQVDSMVAVFHRTVQYEIAQKKFQDGEKIEGYIWTREVTYVPRTDYATGKAMWPGYTVYKGVGEPFSGKLTIWLSKEEFITRKLKGQI